ncbi:OmpH family outer membrane protein [Mailhella sp.]|uniref:OmpH family outer membrane protein n=1 Tax=Mailhella sp. TaxID=1981029 RepID=UPI004063D5DD
MNKPIVSAVVIAALLALLGGCREEKQPQPPKPPFGVVQLTKLYQDSRIGKAGFERLSGLENKAKEELTPFIEKLEKAHADKSDEAERLERDLQERVTYMQDVMRREQEHVTNVLQTALQNAFDAYSKEHGLFGVFSADTMLSSSPEADVTAQIQAMIDAKEPDFGPLPSFKLPPLPVPPNAVNEEKAGGQGEKTGAQ